MRQIQKECILNRGSDLCVNSSIWNAKGIHFHEQNAFALNLRCVNYILPLNANKDFIDTITDIVELNKCVSGVTPINLVRCHGNHCGQTGNAEVIFFVFFVFWTAKISLFLYTCHWLFHVLLIEIVFPVIGPASDKRCELVFVRHVSVFRKENCMNK